MCVVAAAICEVASAYIYLAVVYSTLLLLSTATRKCSNNGNNNNDNTTNNNKNNNVIEKIYKIRKRNTANVLALQ